MRLVDDAILEGTIPDGGIVERLSDIEGCGVSGVLRFDDGDTSGEVWLIAGQIGMKQPTRDDGEDPVDLLLTLRSGTFSVEQRLPPLAVAKGDHRRREGSLEVHVPADLMNYCERAGLTGVLTLEDDGRRAEVHYERGAMATIKLDGADELHEVFGWEEGAFVIEAMRELPKDEAPPPPSAASPAEAKALDAASPDSTGKHFLRVVEMTLSEIVKEREERRPATRTSPPLPKMEARKDTMPPRSIRPKPKRSDQTVKVIYLGDGPAPAIEDLGVKTRHVRTDNTSEVMLVDATPDRRSGETALPEQRAPEDVKPKSKKKKKKKPNEKKRGKPLPDEQPPPTPEDGATNDAKTNDAKTNDANHGATRTNGAKTNATRASDAKTDRARTSETKKKDATVTDERDLHPALWTVMTILVVLGALAFLAALPPIE